MSTVSSSGQDGSFWSSLVLLAAVTLGVVSAIHRAEGGQAGSDGVSRLQLLLLAVAILRLAWGSLYQQNGVSYEPAAASHHNGIQEKRKPRLALPGFPQGSTREEAGIFPNTAFLVVQSEDMLWFEQVVGRIYNLDWVPDEPATVYVQARPTLRAMVEEVMAVGPSTADGAESDSMRVHEPIDYLIACRALLSKDFDVNEAQELVSNYVAWRREIGGLTPPPIPWLERAICLVPFEDRFGRPVIFIRCRQFKPRETSIEVLQQGYRATLDSIRFHLASARGTTMSPTNPLEQFVVMLDVQATGLNNFSVEAMKMIVRESDAHYNDLLSQFFVLFPNSVFQFFWKVVSPLLHDRTKRKIRLIPEAEVPQLISSLVAKPELVPREFGGEAPNWPLPESCVTLQDMGGALAAAAWREAGLAPFTEDPSPQGSQNLGHERREKPGFAQTMPEVLMCCGGKSR